MGSLARAVWVALFCSFVVPTSAYGQTTPPDEEQKPGVSESAAVDIQQTLPSVRPASVKIGKDGKSPILTPRGMRDVGIGLAITGSVLTPVAIGSALNHSETEATGEVDAEAVRNNTIGIALGGTIIAAGILLAATGAKRLKESRENETPEPSAARYEPSQRLRVQWAMSFEGTATPAGP